MADFSSIPCVEVHGTRSEGLTYKGGPTASVTLECDWNVRFDLRTDLMNNGYWPFVPVGGYAPRVQSVEISPSPTDYTQDGQAIDYKIASLQVEYGMDESAGSNPGGGSGGGRQLYTETFEPQLEVISVKGSVIFVDLLGGDGTNPATQKILENPPTVREYTFAIRRVFYNWISVPITFATLVGYVNDADVTFPSLGLTFAPETLLFKPRSSQRAVSTDGTPGYTVAVDFIFRREGWNKLPFTKLDGSFDYLPMYKYDDTANVVAFKPYTLGDFSDWVF